MTADRPPEEVRAAIEESLKLELRAIEEKLVALSERSDVDLEALVHKHCAWRRVAPYLAGFLLALGLALPRAVDATRMHLVRSILRDAPDGPAAFIVYGDMDTVSRSVLRTVRELAPNAEWKVHDWPVLCGQWGCRRRLYTTWDDQIQDAIELDSVRRVAIRVSLSELGQPVWLTRPRPWRGWLHGTACSN